MTVSRTTVLAVAAALLAAPALAQSSQGVQGMPGMAMGAQAISRSPGRAS